MNKIQSSGSIFLVWGFIYGSLLGHNDAQAPPDPNPPGNGSTSTPQLSALALKMVGVCAKPQLVDDYVSHCNSSAISVLPDPDIFQVPPKRPISYILKVRQQNDLLLAEIINRGVYGTKVPAHHPKFGFELVSTTFAIYGKVCPIIPAHFLQAVFHLYSYISWKTAHNRREYLSKRDQRWILKLLNNCTQEVKPSSILTDSCKETAVCKKNCSTFVCTEPENEFRLMRTDPLLDVVHKTMELVQSVCFPFFTESYRMFHFYHLAVMDTITDEMKTRWVTQLDDMEFWRRLLGPSFETHLINIERCNEGTISEARFHYRVSRNSLPARIRLAGRLVKL